MAFCPNCGAELKDGARFCTNCGASTKATSDPVIPGLQQQPTQQPASVVSNEQKYQSLGGWLLFFVICWGISALLGLNSCLYYFTLASYFGLSYIQPDFAPVLGSFVSLALSIAMIICIVRRMPVFLRLYQILSIINIVLSIFTVFTFAAAGAMVAASAVAGVVFGAAGLVLMTMYFCKSARVRVYMKTTQYLDKALFRIGA